MLQGYVGEVEVDAFEQEVGSYEHVGVGVAEHGAIVANAFDS